MKPAILFYNISTALAGAAMMALILLIAGFAGWLDVPSSLEKHLIASFIVSMMLCAFSYFYGQAQQKNGYLYSEKGTTGKHS